MPKKGNEGNESESYAVDILAHLLPYEAVIGLHPLPIRLYLASVRPRAGSLSCPDICCEKHRSPQRLLFV